jgi:hypothetical protein
MMNMNSNSIYMCDVYAFLAIHFFLFFCQKKSILLFDYFLGLIPLHLAGAYSAALPTTYG